MFDKFFQTISTAGETIKEQAASLSETAKEKWLQLIESWISTIPKLEAYGFKTKYFSMSMSLNPTLEIELESTHQTFPIGRIDAILAENAAGSPVSLVFTAIKTTLKLYEKARIERANPLRVKISIRLSPEIKVSFGTASLA